MLEKMHPKLRSHLFTAAALLAFMILLLLVVYAVERGFVSEDLFRSRKKVALICLAVIVVLGVVRHLAFAMTSRRIEDELTERGETAAGLAIDLDVVETSNSQRREVIYYLVYRFEAGEGESRKEYQGRQRVDDSGPQPLPMMVGKPVTVRYLPDRPEFSRIEDLP